MSSPALARPVKMTSSHNVSIPPEMLTLPHWVLANDQKVPHNPRTGRRADPTDPATWGTHAQADARRQREGGHLGYALTLAAGIVCTDLDGCRDPQTGAIAPWAQRIIDALDTYTEPSVSGTGIHLYALATLPAGGRKRGPIEMYDSERYVIVTGQPLPGRDRLQERTAELAALHRETFGDPEPSRPTPITARLDLADDELLERAFNARNGGKVRCLYEGDLSDHGGDDSAADLALVSHLCFWTPDDEQVIRIVAASGLYRPKWDRVDYQRRTIAKARSSGALYDPARSRQEAAGPSCQDDGTGRERNDLPDDLLALKRMIVDLSRRLEAAERRATEAERRAAELSLLQSRTMAAFRSKNLGNEKATGVALAHLTASQGSAKADPDGWLPVPHKRLADGAGVSDQTVPNHLEKLERGVGGFERKVEWVPAVPEHIDETTGEIIEARSGHKQTFIRMTVSPAEFLERIATANPDPEKPKSGWGGRRPVAPCAKHPAADIIKKTVYVCGECGEKLGSDADEIMERCQDDGTAAANNPGAYRQDDRTPPATPPPRRPAQPLLPVDNHYRSANGPASHNTSPPAAPPGSVAAAWQAGQALPGFDSSPRSPLDDRADVAYGRRAP